MAAKPFTDLVENSLFVVRFDIDSDFALVFSAKEDLDKKFEGVSIIPVRLSKGANYITLLPEVVKELFNPEVSIRNESEWQFTVNPLQGNIIIKRGPHGKYVCLYPFPEQGRRGKIVDVLVVAKNYLLPSVTLHVTVTASYKSAADAPTETLQRSSQCSREFIDKLRAMFSK